MRIDRTAGLGCPQCVASAVGLPMDLELFRRRLAETIAWCARRASVADPRGCLRTPELLPASVRKAGELPLDEWKPTQVHALVEAVAAERVRRLTQDGLLPVQPAEDLAGGYLLVCAP